MRVVVVGYGMSGARLVGELYARDPELDVTVVGAEPHPAYNRILLSGIVAGTVREPDIALVEPAAHRASARLGVAALDVDRAARTVRTSGGDRLRYDRLVLATGGRPVLPAIKGLVGDDGSLPDRVVPFRTLDDCRRIAALASGARTALVLGGGLLGLEAARGLALRGLAVTVLHAVGHLMDRQLDAAASAVLADSLAALGVRVQLDACTVAVAPAAGQVEAVLADGRRLAADLLVVACGTRPETDLAVRAGLAVERGIVVDDRMRSSDPRVFAIGDCAEHAGTVTGLVAPAWAQARVAADVLTAARPLSRYRPTAPVTRLKAAGIDLAAMGDSTRTGGDHVTYADPARGTYAKLLVRGNRLSGAILIGDNPTIGTVIQMFDRGTPLPADPRALLLGRQPGCPAPVGAPQGSPSLMPDAAVVCQCNTVTKKDLVNCWRGGARSVGDLIAGTRAGTGCGSCRDTVEGILGWLRGAEEECA